MIILKVEIGLPKIETPNEGRLEISVEVCPSVSAKIVGREASDMNNEYTQMMTRYYNVIHAIIL